MILDDYANNALKDLLDGKESVPNIALAGLAIIDAPKHDFRNIAEARAWAKKNISGIYHNINTNENICISKTVIDKYLSEKAVKKSVSVEIHLSTLKKLPVLIETSVLKEKHNDINNDTNIQEIQRFYGAINYYGANYLVKITVKAIKGEEKKAYSYEVM